jgi:DNA-binding NarL/FixJ family response regulator
VQRRQAHRALAELTRGQLERHAWHLAQSAPGPDERIAALLEQAAHDTLRQGDAVSAVTALIRAAQMSTSHPDRSRRLARAAYIGAAVTGDLDEVAQLIAEARAFDATPGSSLHTTVAVSYVILHREGDIDTAHRLVAGSLEAQAGAADPGDATLDAALYTLMLACHLGSRAELWEPFDATVRRLGPRVQPLLALLRDTFADPAHRAASVAARLSAAISALDGELDPTRIVRTGAAAHYLSRTGECRHALWRVVRDGRAGGAVTSAIDALVLLGFDSLWSGDWDEADTLLAECLRLCDAHGYRTMSWPGLYGRALLAAMRGDHETATSGADRLSRWAAPRGARSLLAYASHVRTIDHLGRGEFEDAYRQAVAVSPPGVLARNTPQAIWLIFDLVDAAVHTGRRAEALAHVQAARAAGFDAISPRLTLLTIAAHAVAAPMEAAEELFEAALAVPGADRWVFESARIRLAYGERLRRAKATAKAREQLLDALDTFQRQGAEPWARHAGDELRATGYDAAHGNTLTTRAWPSRITARDLEIASLAASGLSNKQIATRLYLSDRTVGAHLYRLFPKLGITSRAALRDALDALPSVGTTTSMGVRDHRQRPCREP